MQEICPFHSQRKGEVTTLQKTLDSGPNPDRGADVK
jgi:hypothetical protein